MPWSGPCPPGAFNNGWEQIDASSIVGAVFCSGQTRDFTIDVGPGTTTQAATGDLEYITLFFDFDCDGIFEYSVNDSCSYVRPDGCSVNLSVAAPVVTASTTFNARAHLVYNQSTNDPCANLPGSTPWGDIYDFTIDVNLPPQPVLTASDTDAVICAGDTVTFTATDGDEYEFYVNGVSSQAQSTNATFSTAALSDGDIVTVRAIDLANGCDTFSSGITFTVPNPQINIQPVVSQTVIAGTNSAFSVNASDVDTYQWQVSTDGGVSYARWSMAIVTVAPLPIALPFFRQILIWMGTATGCSWKIPWRVVPGSFQMWEH